MRIRTCLLALLLAAPAGASTIVLDFEEEPLADYGDFGTDPFFVSAECGCVRFSDLGGENEVHVIDYEEGSRSVLAGWQGGTLVMEFLVPVVGLSLDFVNPFDEYDVWLNQAVLTAYSGGEIVGVATLPPAPQGPRFQTISISPGTVIERAVFRKNDLGEYSPFSPIVDNVVLVTPEPSGLALWGLAFAGVVATRAHGRRSAGSDADRRR